MPIVFVFAVLPTRRFGMRNVQAFAQVAFQGCDVFNHLVTFDLGICSIIHVFFT